MKRHILRWLLMAGTVYFAGVALFHQIGFKIPGFYIYYNVPSHAYQDKLIAMFAFGWAAFFFIAAQEPEKFMHLIRTILVIGGVAVAGLVWINFSSDFEALNPEVNNTMFSLEILPLFIYWILLVVYTIRFDKKV